MSECDFAGTTGHSVPECRSGKEAQQCRRHPGHISRSVDESRAGWYNHVNLNAHDKGGHFIPWEIPDLWVDDLRRTFRGYR